MAAASLSSAIFFILKATSTCECILAILACITSTALMASAFALTSLLSALCKFRTIREAGWEGASAAPFEEPSAPMLDRTMPTSSVMVGASGAEGKGLAEVADKGLSVSSSSCSLPGEIKSVSLCFTGVFSASLKVTSGLMGESGICRLGGSENDLPRSRRFLSELRGWNSSSLLARMTSGEDPEMGMGTAALAGGVTFTLLACSGERRRIDEGLRAVSLMALGVVVYLFSEPVRPAGVILLATSILCLTVACALFNRSTCFSWVERRNKSAWLRSTSPMPAVLLRLRWWLK
mmetsp:Transcript_1112/g.4219  ORF Transcript_1112/g.4219 Transcript_1112/m.4219 type:complete len:292 (+) Transcript_1112:469-1344(+)